MDGNTYDLQLVVDDKRIRAFTGFPRPDVARAQGNDPAFKNSGFLIRFNRPRLRTPVTLSAVTEAGEIVLADSIAVPEFDKETNESYGDWVETELPARLQALIYQPSISILLAVPSDHPYFITRCIESIRQQHYARWQVCLACNASELGSAYAYLNKISNEDSRICFSDPGQTALASAEGDFILRVNHQDELHPCALFEIVSALNSGETFDIVYTDEEEIDLYGNRTSPVFKPDFDPEALLSWNFIGSCATIRRDVLLKAGGYKIEPSETDDWDVLLRVLEISGSRRVRHISKPLYHVRASNRVAASSAAIESYIRRRGEKASVEPGVFPDSFRLKRKKQTDWRIAVFVRSEDGLFQHAVLAPNIDRRGTRIYELLGGGADLLASEETQEVSRFTARSLSEMPEDIFVFINRPLDTLNHFFFEELATQAMRDDCGLVTGISLDRTGGILSSDEFAGIPFSQGDRLREISIVRSVDSISDEFFAAKRSQLVTLAGFGAIVSTRMPQVVRSLIDLARSQSLRILVTPYAVATFDLPCSQEKGTNHEEPMPDDIYPIPQDELAAAQAERRLAARQLSEIASERNRLRRELILLEESIRHLKTNKPLEAKISELNQQNRELREALDAERRVMAEIQNSASWKLTGPLRAWKRLLRRES
jgi:hypothetical protein